MSSAAQPGLIARLKDTLSRVEAEGEHLLHAAEADVMHFFDGVKQHLTDHPEPVFAILRNIKPVLVVKNTALVTRYRDVQEVLTRDDVFQVTYAPKMRQITGGPDFFLNMPDSPEYERDLSHMRTVFRREDMGRIAAIVAENAGALTTAAGSKMDVAQLSHTAVVRWIAAYFGCVADSEQDLSDWAHAIFHFIFLDTNNDPAVGAAALAAAAKMRPWLDGVIARRKAQPTTADDGLNRCLVLQRAGLPGMDDVSIRNLFVGLIAGGIPTTAKCAVQALDELLKRPEHLAGAQEAARAGNDALLAQYVFEALRFNPNNAGLLRLAAEDYTLARSELHATKIPKGTTVLVATQSAMFDGRLVDEPNEFRIGRPPWVYMHYGHALHVCFGQYMSQVQIPGILKPLLARRGLRRAAGAAGQLQMNGPFPASLGVEWDG